MTRGPSPSGRPDEADTSHATTTVEAAPATAGRPKHEFDSGTALTAMLAVMALRETPMPAASMLAAPGPADPYKEKT